MAEEEGTGSIRTREAEAEVGSKSSGGHDGCGEPEEGEDEEGGGGRGGAEEKSGLNTRFRVWARSSSWETNCKMREREETINEGFYSVIRLYYLTGL